MRRVAASAVLSALIGLTSCDLGRPRGLYPVLKIDPEEVHPVPGSAEFSSVRDVTLVDSTLWVLNGHAPFLTRVSLTTGEVQEYGAQGGGPREFGSPWAVQPAGDLSPAGVRVWDMGGRRVLTFDSEGEWVSSAPLNPSGIVRARGNIREVSYVDPFRMRADPKGVVMALYPGPVSRTADASEGSVWRASWGLEPLTELATFGGEGGGTFIDRREWAAVSLWDACEGTVVLWDPDSSQVEWFDSGGSRKGTVGVELDPGPVTPEDVQVYLRHMARLELGPEYANAGINFEAVAQRIRGRFAENRPPATDLRCQGPDTVWLRLFEPSIDPVGRGRSWLRIPREGSISRVDFPDTFDPVLFTPSHAFGFHTAPDGTRQLARWTMTHDPQPISHQESRND